MMENDSQPKNSAHPLYMLLHSEEIEDFNTQREAHDDFSVLKGLDFRGLDLRGAELTGFDLSDGYFRQTDLRGLDLRTCNLEGASLRSAKISGTYFPDELSPDEILMSLNHGTRLRYR
ncbi:pentapeptide repeat-containing protein [Desulfuromonas acetoxidans]|nr:pentapeptide repeat-containing protein [Desulfuromonas acetoxidans]